MVKTCNTVRLNQKNWKQYEYVSKFKFIQIYKLVRILKLLLMDINFQQQFHNKNKIIHSPYQIQISKNKYPIT